MYSTRQNMRSILLIVIGSCILAFGSYNFNYQNNVTEGGVLGLILLIKNILNVSPSITSIIIDFSLFALGARFFGKRFMIFSVLATVSFSFFYSIWEGIGFIVPNLSDNMLIASILSGIGVGLGVGLVIRGGGASGGDDVIALLGEKFTPLKLNHVYFLTDAVVLVMSLVYLEISQVLFSIIAVSISGKLISLIYDDSEKEDDEDTDCDVNKTITV